MQCVVSAFLPTSTPPLVPFNSAIFFPPTSCFFFFLLSQSSPVWVVKHIGAQALIAPQLVFRLHTSISPSPMLGFSLNGTYTELMLSQTL